MLKPDGYILLSDVDNLINAARIEARDAGNEAGAQVLAALRVALELIAIDMAMTAPPLQGEVDGPSEDEIKRAAQAMENCEYEPGWESLARAALSAASNAGESGGCGRRTDACLIVFVSRMATPMPERPAPKPPSPASLEATLQAEANLQYAKEADEARAEATRRAEYHQGREEEGQEIEAELRKRIAELEAGPSKAAVDVLAERRRQVEAEGWSPEHDDTHVRGEMMDAAICYLHRRREEAAWPWDRSWWKPTDRRRDLVKAGALILAEIERLDRALLARIPTDQPAKGE